MTFARLIDSLKHLESSPDQSASFHLGKDRNNSWVALSGEPSSDQQSDLKALASEVQQAASVAPMGAEDLDILEMGIRKLKISPSPNALVALFSASLKTNETDAFLKFWQATQTHFQRLHLQDVESVKRSLAYLAKINDINRFAALFRAFYYSERAASNEARQRFEEDLKQFITKLCENLAPNEVHWLRRVQDDPEWLCSIVPCHAFAKNPKRLDLRNCGFTTIKMVLAAHSDKGFTHLVVLLNCSQSVFCTIAVQHYLDDIVELDLRECRGYSWLAIQTHLAKLDRLETCTLPDSLAISRLFITWDASWHSDKKEKMQLILERIVRKQNARNNFTFISDFMRGILGSRSFNFENINRAQVNFLLSAESQISKLSPFECLSLSGIKRATVEILSKFPLMASPVVILLTHCPLVTRDGLQYLFMRYHILRLSLCGCRQVDDSFFEDHPLVTKENWFTGELNVSGTLVTQGLVDIIRRKQPKATIRYLDYYLTDLAKISEESFGVDSQGLSQAALDVILHLKYTGIFPLVDIQTAMELIVSTDTILQSGNIRNKLKEYCRYILQINVDRSNVFELYSFSVRVGDMKLMYVGRLFVETFFSPAQPNEWSKLSDEEKRITHTILRDPMPPEAVFDDDDDILYAIWAKDEIRFSEDCQPLIEYVRRGNFLGFAARYFKFPEESRAREVAKLAAKFPCVIWLDYFLTNPEWIRSILPDTNEEAKLKRLDLRMLCPNLIVTVLSAFKKYAQLEVVLKCTQGHFLEAYQRGVLKNVVSIDLSECTGLERDIVQPVLGLMPKLENILPNSLQLSVTEKWLQEEVRRAEKYARQQQNQLFGKPVVEVVTSAQANFSMRACAKENDFL